MRWCMDLLQNSLNNILRAMIGRTTHFFRQLQFHYNSKKLQIVRPVEKTKNNKKALIII